MALFHKEKTKDELDDPLGGVGEILQAQPQQQYPQYSQPPPNYPPQEQAMPPPQVQPQLNEEKVQEIVEVVIDEKWQEFSKDMKTVVDWKERNENKIVQLQQQMQDIKSDIVALKAGVLGKVSEYDKNLSNVGVEIKAMEKVFQKVLPSLTESVNRLDRMSKTKTTKSALKPKK
tara:strand:- start:1406 stop:1927 length:522 start_codon:yes stop_codon:yes gene_type:complete